MLLNVLNKKTIQDAIYLDYEKILLVKCIAFQSKRSRITMYSLLMRSLHGFIDHLKVHQLSTKFDIFSSGLYNHVLSDIYRLCYNKLIKNYALTITLLIDLNLVETCLPNS